MQRILPDRFSHEFGRSCHASVEHKKACGYTFVIGHIKYLMSSFISDCFVIVARRLRLRRQEFE